jgi:putative acetyltransferase
MNIRDENISDKEDIWALESEVFETAAEANLVNALRNSGCEFISLVAETENKIVGHILFTPVELTGCDNRLKIMGLAPMAVMSQYQNGGVGSSLIKAGLERCRSSGYDAVVVLGYPNYYTKFGFVPSIKYRIRSEYDVPAEVFMILELVPNALKNQHGIIKYHKAFDNV